MKTILISTVLILNITSVFAKKPLNSQALKDRLWKETRENHKGLSYQDAKKILFATVENIDGFVCSVYTKDECQKRHYKDPSDLSYSFMKEKKAGKGFKINIEHTWPQSKGAKIFPAVSDMHHLFATTKESNSKRGSFPFCNVAVEFWEHGGSKLGIDMYSQDCFEPRDEHKGNVARAMFYFSIRYKLKIDKDQEAVFREWNILDPVDGRELERDQLVEKFQGNYNPFIRDISLVDQIKDF